MANEEQLSILKQGVEVWNRWRAENADVEIDLSEADLRDANLRGCNLRFTNLMGAKLFRADLSEADFSQAHLLAADLSEAISREASFKSAILSKADLRRSYLFGADFSDADLSETNFMRADLNRATLSGVLFSETNLSLAFMGHTTIVNVDLRKTIGLEDVHHSGPSNITTSAFAFSNGKIPNTFLQGCGLSDWEIEMVKLYNPDLSNEERNKILYRIYDLQASQAIQISPLFISYSHADHNFVDKLGDELAEKGVRYWRDIREMKAGRVEKQLDMAIRQNPTVLLVLSEHSLRSDWVEHEVRTARELEKDLRRDVLCPVALDDSWKSSRWPKRVMEQIMEYNILDFSAWQDDVKFESTFRRLIDGLELFYKG